MISSSLSVVSRTAALISSRKWPAIHDLAKSFGAAIVKVSSESSIPRASPNQVW